MTKIEDAYKLNEELHEVAKKQMMVDIEDRDNKAVFVKFVLGKAYKTHEAVMLLCKNKYGEDAFMLSRTLFELMVMMCYILADSNEGRLMRYISYDWVIRKNMLDYSYTDSEICKNLQEQISSGNGTKETLEEIEIECKKVMEKYHYKNNTWSDKSIEQMAKDIGRWKAYKTVYNLQCGISHTNPRSMNEYGKETEQGIVLNVGENVQLTETALILCIDFFGTIFEKAAEHLGWDIKKEINDISKNLSEKIFPSK